jgi:hypothetical protein
MNNHLNLVFKISLLTQGEICSLCLGTRKWIFKRDELEKYLHPEMSLGAVGIRAGKEHYGKNSL